jgi:two-component system, chemotaxis family, protein-glutamate methylesterase/glutaminase
VLRALRAGKAAAVPVVVVSAFSPAHGARAVDALSEGAFDLVAKPAMGESMADFTAELSKKVNDAADSGKLRARRPRVAAAPAIARRPPVRAASANARPGTKKFVVIASSTGGPKALGELIPRLPASLGTGSLIVQHMPPGFTASLAARLDGMSKLTVREAAGHEAMDPRHIYLAPGGSHLRMGDDRKVRLSDEAPMGGLRPRADLTIADAAKLYGNAMVLVVLTGMGKDGLDGARAVKKAGGRILVEAESTCVVYGMPRAVAEAGLADEILPLNELPAAIAREAGS